MHRPTAVDIVQLRAALHRAHQYIGLVLHGTPLKFLRAHREGSSRLSRKTGATLITNVPDFPNTASFPGYPFRGGRTPIQGKPRTLAVDRAGTAPSVVPSPAAGVLLMARPSFLWRGSVNFLWRGPPAKGTSTTVAKNNTQMVWNTPLVF